MNAETLSYNAVSGRVDRDRLFVFHNQDMIGDQGSATITHTGFGLPNKLVVGFDYNHLYFIRSHGFPDGPASTR
jgi:iron complex outermembrane receptor protein